MGNRLISYATNEDSEGPSPKTIDYFKKIRIKWLDYFLSKLLVCKQIEVQINDKNVPLNWKEYFQIMTEIHNKVEKENELEKRLTWHPTTLGYTMEFEPKSFSYLKQPLALALPDDFTDDEPDPSELSDSDDDTANTSKPKSNLRDIVAKSASIQHEPVLSSQPDGWDPRIINPIFFGYTKSRTIDEIKREEEKMKQTLQAEERAIKKAEATRASLIDEFETAIKGRETARIKKMEEVQINIYIFIY